MRGCSDKKTMERLDRSLILPVLLVFLSYFSVSCSMDAEVFKGLNKEATEALPSVSQNVILEAASPLQTNTSPLVVRARFGADITGLDLSMFILENASLQIIDSELVGKERRYKMELIPDHDGVVSIHFEKNELGLNGESGTKLFEDSNTLIFNVDSEGPQLQISNPSPMSAITGSSFTWTLTYSDFSEVSLQTSDISLQRTGSVANCLVSISTVSTSVRTVTISSCTGSGTVRLQVADGSARDAVGNLAAGSLSNAATLTPTLSTTPNLMKSVLSGGSASVVEIGVSSGGGGVYNGSLDAPCTYSWSASGTLCDDDIYSDFVSDVIWGSGYDRTGSTWSTYGDPTTVGYLIVDLGAARTIGSFSVFQMFSDGKVTHVQIFAHSSSADPHPAQTDGAWAELTAGMTQVGAQTVVDDRVTDPLRINLVAPVSTRYLKIHAKNDGSLGNPSYIEIRSIKAFAP